MGENEDQLRQEWRSEVKSEIHKLEAKVENLQNDQSKIFNKLVRIEVMLESGNLRVADQPAHTPTKQHRLEAGGMALGAVTIAEAIKWIAHFFK